MPDQKRYYINDTGTGNTVNLSHPRVLQMVTDSLRYWASEMHVDGFRFDLGPALGRMDHGFDPDAPLLQAMRADPVLADWVKQVEPPAAAPVRISADWWSLKPLVRPAVPSNQYSVSSVQYSVWDLGTSARSQFPMRLSLKTDY